MGIFRALRIIFKLETVFVFVTARCYFPSLRTVCLLGTGLEHLRETALTRPVAVLWIRWLPIFSEKGMRLEDGSGIEITAESLEVVDI